MVLGSSGEIPYQLVAFKVLSFFFFIKMHEMLVEYNRFYIETVNRRNVFEVVLGENVLQIKGFYFQF